MDQDENLVCYKTLSIWTAETLPDAFKSRHNTKAGTWAKLAILSGHLTMEFMSENGAITGSAEYSTKHQPPVIKPRQYHRIAYYSNDLRCQLSFYTQEVS